MTAIGSDTPRDEQAGAYVIEATSDTGLTVRTGPFDIGEALLLVDGTLIPGGWNPRFLPLYPVDKAMNVFGVSQRRPVAGSEMDLFVALRRAIITDQEYDGADCPRAGAHIAHIEAHRPMRMFIGDEGCMLSECGHDTVAGVCVELEEAEPICVTCSAVYDSGSEWGPEWLPACLVTWPCQPIRATADYYGVPLPGQAPNESLEVPS